jgi:Cu-Zn family superoxide dismutase
MLCTDLFLKHAVIFFDYSKENWRMKIDLSKRTLGVLMFGLFVCSGFAQHEGHHAQTQTAPAKIAALTKAVAVLHPTAGNTAHGTVTFTQEEGGVRVVVNLTGVPTGEHGFHIHEFGDCSAADAASAGGHFNPDNMAHGAQQAQTRHVGDLGNVTADANGAVTLNLLDPRLSMNGPQTIIGRGLILHAKPDDFTTQPTGNAGGRVACGVIGVTKP